MKIGILAGSRGAATDNLMRPLRDCLQDLGHTVELACPDENTKIEYHELDILHVSYIGYLPDICARPPTTLQVHHIDPTKNSEYLLDVARISPDKIIVHDSYWAQHLGIHGIMNVRVIPHAFDYSRFPVLPYPETFSLGILGTDYPYKRFDVVREVAEDLNIPLIDGARKDPLESASPSWIDDPLEFYGQVSCYVVSTFLDTGPLPPQEALCCGRPVISTYTGLMPNIVIQGDNGGFFDGTHEDLTRAVVEARDNYQTLAQGARATVLPDVETAARQYEAVFREVLEDA